MILVKNQSKANQSDHTCMVEGDKPAHAMMTCRMEHDVPVTLVAVDQLIPYKGNARTHSHKQVRQIADSIARFGFTNPVLIDDDGMIIAGHGRVKAAKLLGLTAIPALRLSHLSAAEKRAYVIADNRLAEKAGWDAEILAIELRGLIDLDFEVELTGFGMDEIEIILDEGNKATQEGSRAETDAPLPAVSRPGDHWMLGSHQLICGDPLEAADEADVAIRLWQTYAGKSAKLAATGQTFEEVRRVRTGPASPPSAIAAKDAAAVEEVR
jgi:hypothetical protein